MSLSLQLPHTIVPVRAAVTPGTMDRVTPARLTLLNAALLGYVFFLPMQLQSAQFNVAPSDLLLFLAMLYGFARLSFVPGAWSAFHVGMLSLFGFGAVMTAFTTGALGVYVVIKVAGLVILFVSYLCFTSAATSWQIIRSFLRVFVIASTLHSAVAVAAFLAGFSASWLNYGTDRVSGMLIDPNAFGGLVMVALVFQVVTQRAGAPLVKGIPGLVAILILSLALVFTLSRSAWIGLAFAIICISLLRPRFVALWAVLAVAAVGIAYVLLGMQDRSRTVQLAQRENTAMQRIEQIQEAWSMFSEHPVLGAGVGAFSRDQDPGHPQAHIIHNTTAWILAEFGLTGLTVYLGFMSWFFLQGRAALRRARPEAEPLILALMCAHAGMLGVSSGIEALYQRHWWMVLALIASSWILTRRDTATSFSSTGVSYPYTASDPTVSYAGASYTGASR